MRVGWWHGRLAQESRQDARATLTILASRSLVKRERHDLRANQPPAHVDFNCAPLVGELDRNISHADVLLQEGRGTSRCHSSNSVAVDQNIMSIASYSAVGNFKAYKLAFDTFLFLLC